MDASRVNCADVYAGVVPRVAARQVQCKSDTLSTHVRTDEMGVRGRIRHVVPGEIALDVPGDGRVGGAVVDLIAQGDRIIRQWPRVKGRGRQEVGRQRDVIPGVGPDKGDPGDGHGLWGGGAVRIINDVLRVEVGRLGGHAQRLLVDNPREALDGKAGGGLAVVGPIGDRGDDGQRRPVHGLDHRVRAGPEVEGDIARGDRVPRPARRLEGRGLEGRPALRVDGDGGEGVAVVQEGDRTPGGRDRTLGYRGGERDRVAVRGGGLG